MSFVCTQNHQRAFETISEIDHDMSKSYQRKLEQDAKKQLQDVQDQKQQLEKQKNDRK